VAHRAGANHGNSFNRWRTASWAAHAPKNRAPERPKRPQATEFDYLIDGSYTIRSTEMAILPALNG
jgi:hypothetical protein